MLILLQAGETALMCASSKGYEEIVVSLLKRQAEVHRQNMVSYHVVALGVDLLSVRDRASTQLRH